MKDINDFIYTETIKANNALVDAKVTIGGNDYGEGLANGNLQLLAELKKFISVNNCVSGNEAVPEIKQSGEVAVCVKHFALSKLPLTDKFKYCSTCGYYCTQTDR